MKRAEHYSIVGASRAVHGLVLIEGLVYGPIRLAFGLNKLNRVHMALPKNPCRNAPYVNGLNQYEQNEQRPPPRWLSRCAAPYRNPRGPEIMRKPMICRVSRSPGFAFG